MPDSIGKPRFDPTITAGTAIQIGLIVFGLVTYFLTSGNKVDQASREVTELRETVNAQNSSTREALASQASGTRDSIREAMGRVDSTMSAISAQVQTLPPMTERVRRAEADITALQKADAELSARIEARRNAVDLRFDALQKQLIENTARMEAVSRANSPPR